MIAGRKTAGRAFRRPMFSMSHRQPTLEDWQRERANPELLNVPARERISPHRKAFQQLRELLRRQIKRRAR